MPAVYRLTLVNHEGTSFSVETDNFGDVAYAFERVTKLLKKPETGRRPVSFEDETTVMASIP